LRIGERPRGDTDVCDEHWEANLAWQSAWIGWLRPCDGDCGPPEDDPGPGLRPGDRDVAADAHHCTLDRLRHANAARRCVGYSHSAIRDDDLEPRRINFDDKVSVFDAGMSADVPQGFADSASHRIRYWLWNLKAVGGHDEPHRHAKADSRAHLREIVKEDISRHRVT
jgi:hypothetical protein